MTEAGQPSSPGNRWALNFFIVREDISDAEWENIPHEWWRQGLEGPLLFVRRGVAMAIGDTLSEECLEVRGKSANFVTLPPMSTSKLPT